MDKTKPIAALFDLDGVILDTESQYSLFWKNIGKTYLNNEGIVNQIKGTSLKHIYETFFPNRENDRKKISAELEEFERNMKMEFIPGAQNFIGELRSRGIKTAVVTSSNLIKMQAVYKAQPEIKSLFDKILTAEQFTKSKPAPDPYLLGAKVFGTVEKNCVVFEDSFNGLKSGRAAGMNVIGLATTNPKDEISPYADLVINDFTELTLEKFYSVLER
ncbi:HAD family phosphatase [Treponema parvum]|uniref:HAD family phosphatase n=1 Tax=Treponema parvum TaxID=138851 RepID=A0A975F0S1_9SPIR|nr:HAD family phosphatase [Treponema parvum]QTQ12379.1 HAD family phosphatase [Treponema parvum]QTQ15629.1 HAD family phosphatase [Treponema parvum]